MGKVLVDIWLLGFALAVSPGPDFFLMTKHTLSNGRTAGYMTLLGNRCSLSLHILFALVGLSVVLKQSAMLFTTMKLLGAVYLIYLGCKKLKNLVPHPKDSTTNKAKETLLKRQAFRSGFITNLLNPKVSIFFLSIFPQFSSSDQLMNQSVTIGVVFLLGNSMWYIPILFLIGMRFVRSAVMRIQKGVDIAFGTFFVVIGGKIIGDELIP